MVVPTPIISLLKRVKVDDAVDMRPLPYTIVVVVECSFVANLVHGQANPPPPPPVASSPSQSDADPVIVVQKSDH